MSFGTVLVVDDKTDDVMLLKRAMGKKNIDAEVQAISDPRQAIDYLQGVSSYSDRNQFPYPRMIFVDIRTTHGSGFELLRWIRDNPIYQVIPIVVLTGSDYKLDVKRAYYEGANCYVLKPANADQLEALIETLFNFWKMNALPDM
jgi:CheY-like chemotaxis protein